MESAWIVAKHSALNHPCLGGIRVVHALRPHSMLLYLNLESQSGKKKKRPKGLGFGGRGNAKSGAAATAKNPAGGLSASNIGGGGGEQLQLPRVTHTMNLAELLQNAKSENHSFPRFICDAADSFVTSFLTPLSKRTRSPSMDPALVLRDICSPVSETPPTKCPVVRGHVPPDLVGGAYLRNGPNANMIHAGDGYHILDGDGMLHGVTLKQAPPEEGGCEPLYCSKFVQTSRFLQETEAGRPLMVKIFGGMSGVAGMARAAVTLLRSSFGLLDLRHGFGLSNTSICHFNGQILSLSEDDMPYVVRLSDDGDISTVRRLTLPSKHNMCAHPKLDPETGDMYAFQHNIPFLQLFAFFRLSVVDGSRSRDVPIPVRDMTAVHDFAITPRFIVFPDTQLVVKPWEMFRGAMPLVCDVGKTSRFCLITRETLAMAEEFESTAAAAAAIFMDAPDINCLHVVNAWEEGDDEVVLVVPVITPPDRILNFSEIASTLSEIRLNTSTRKVSVRPILPAGSDYVEFGVVNPNYVGRKTRYAYFATKSFPHIAGVVKLDLSLPQSAAIVGKRDFASDGWYGGEPFFVPARNAVSEDDGFLLCLVGNLNSDVSHLLIMDARSSSLEVMAAVELPTRVPPGFHGCFVTAEQLAQQKP